MPIEPLRLCKKSIFFFALQEIRPLGTVNTQYLRSGRNLEVPFRVVLESEGSIAELVCTQILRIIPGKRLVCSGKWNDTQIIVKILLNPRSARRHFDREIKGINALKNAGIRTPSLILKGSLQKEDTPVLVFQRIMPAYNPREVILKAESDEKTSELLRQISAVIAEQHEAGLKQNDLHLGNFILSGNDIYTIDGDTVDTDQTGRPLPETISLNNLGLFLAQLNPEFDRLSHFALQTYAEKRSWRTDKNLLDNLLKEVKNQRKYRKNKYLNKIFRECTAFMCQKSWNRFMVCERDSYHGEMKKLLSDPAVFITSSKLLKDGRSSTVALAEVNGKPLVIKRYNIKNFIHALKRCPRSTRAWSSWRNAHRLELLGIPTPKPIAFLEKRWGPFRSTSYYITEYVEGTDLYRLIVPDKLKELNLGILSKRFGEILKSLANASMSHGDFKSKNFLSSDDMMYIIDIEGMKEHRFKWRFKKALKRDCERFMRNWKKMPEVARVFQKQIKETSL